MLTDFSSGGNIFQQRFAESNHKSIAVFSDFFDAIGNEIGVGDIGKVCFGISDNTEIGALIPAGTIFDPD
jgi:hypothetical protein